MSPHRDDSAPRGKKGIWAEASLSKVKNVFCLNMHGIYTGILKPTITSTNFIYENKKRNSSFSSHRVHAKIYVESMGGRFTKRCGEILGNGRTGKEQCRDGEVNFTNTSERD